VDLPGKLNQPICVLAHGADDHDNLVPFELGADRLARGRQNQPAVGHARAAEFLHYDGHARVPSFTPSFRPITPRRCLHRRSA